jgi:tetratricopeptide (TPR) repeat protein
MDMTDLKREHDCVEIGDRLDFQGEYEKAIAAYNSALRIVPGDADVLFDKGETLVKMGDLAEAGKCFDLALGMYNGY